MEGEMYRGENDKQIKWLKEMIGREVDGERDR